MNFLRWIKELTLPPSKAVTLIPVSNWVDIMDGAHAHKCRECGAHFHLSPLGIGQCPQCQSHHIFHIESWLRTPGEQVAHAASRRSTRFVRAVNGGIPLPLPKEVVVIAGNNTTVRTVVPALLKKEEVAP